MTEAHKTLKTTPNSEHIEEGLNKMAAILQTIFSNTFYSMKMF